MTNRDWIGRVLAHEGDLPVPYNFMFSPPAERVARAVYGDDLEAGLRLPMRMTGPASPKPLYADPDAFGATATDEFGVTWSTSRVDRGAPIGPCLPEPDLAGYCFPDPAAPVRFADIPAWCARQEGHYRVIWVGDLWERATFMRGMEELLLDVALHPAFVEALLDRLADGIVRTIEILAGLGPFEAVAVSDDYGTQQGLLMAPATWRRLVRPHLARVYAAAKAHGLAVFHHSCGNIFPVIGDLIDLGLDILHPIQPEAMDVIALKRRFGGDLTFCGGVSTQHLLVTGTPAAVRAEVARLRRELGAGGGYILEPGITLQADVPPANLLALLAAATGIEDLAVPHPLAKRGLGAIH